MTQIGPNEARKSVLAGLGHALNNPMSAVLGNIVFISETAGKLGLSTEPYDRVNSLLSFEPVRPEETERESKGTDEEVAREEVRRWVGKYFKRVQEVLGEKSDDAEAVWARWDEEVGNAINNLPDVESEEDTIKVVKSEAKKVVFIIGRLRKIAEGKEVLPPIKEYLRGSYYYDFLDRYNENEQEMDLEDSDWNNIVSYCQSRPGRKSAGGKTAIGTVQL